jgi:catechol 2,3-dioxygenase-like lactoylglutathione lyase family enzyme
MAMFDALADPELVGVGGLPRLAGVHHVRLPVSNVLVSVDWYVRVLGLQCLLVEEDEDSVSGAVLFQPGIVIGLHRDPQRAAALRGFVVVALAVNDLAAWVEYLDRSGVLHGAPEVCHPGRGLEVPDPDGILVELHSIDQPSADEA